MVLQVSVYVSQPFWLILYIDAAENAQWGGPGGGGGGEGEEEEQGYTEEEEGKDGGLENGRRE